jgi:predicted HTH domain antitoxin
VGLLVDFPEEVTLFTDSNELKTVAIVKLYELGRLSSGKAAKLLGISRVEFLELLGKYKVQYMAPFSGEELLRDIENA